MNNLEIWDKLRTPPKEVLKTITSGRLKNMTDIKPQWRYQVMTEQFGVCGIGWKYTIDRQRIEDGVGEHKFAFVDVSLFVKVDGEWSEAIPGNGGSMLIAKESAGPHMNDEAFKMATTDALSVAMSRIGVGADIYMGQAYQSKYTTPAPTTNAKKEPPLPHQQSIITQGQDGLLTEQEAPPAPPVPISVSDKMEWLVANRPEVLREAYRQCGFNTMADKEALEAITGKTQAEKVIAKCKEISEAASKNA